MSHILIIGGMGPQASIYAHRRLIDVANHRGARTNEDYSHILNSVAQSALIHLQYSQPLHR